MSVRNRIFFGVFDGGKYLFRFWRERVGSEGSGVLEYYTDTSAEKFSSWTPKVIEVISRYLELKEDEKKKAEEKDLEEASKQGEQKTS